MPGNVEPQPDLKYSVSTDGDAIMPAHVGHQPYPDYAEPTGTEIITNRTNGPTNEAGGGQPAPGALQERGSSSRTYPAAGRTVVMCPVSHCPKSFEDATARGAKKRLRKHTGYYYHQVEKYELEGKPTTPNMRKHAAAHELEMEKAGKYVSSL